MEKENIYIERDIIAEFAPEALCADGFDEAIIGYAMNFNETTVLYDYYKCIDILIERDGMSYEEAVEFFDYNVLGSWLGSNMPTFAVLKKDII